MDQRTINTIVTQLRTEFPAISEEGLRLKVNGLVKIADDAEAEPSAARTEKQALTNRVTELVDAQL